MAKTKKMKTRIGKNFVFVQLISGTPMQIQQLIDILNKLKAPEFEFIVTNQYVEWNTIDAIIDALSKARREHKKKLKENENV